MKINPYDKIAFQTPPVNQSVGTNVGRKLVNWADIMIAPVRERNDGMIYKVWVGEGKIKSYTFESETKAYKDLTIIDKLVAFIGIYLKRTVIFFSKTIADDYLAVRNGDSARFHFKRIELDPNSLVARLLKEAR